MAEQEGVGALAVERKEEDENINDNEGFIAAIMLLNNPEYNVATAPTNLYEIAVI